MSERIHYEDNIYFIRAFIRTLNDAVKLNIDADFFADKILEDTLFLDNSITKIHTSLKENQHLIRRQNYLHSVMKLKRSYCRLLDDILASSNEDFLVVLSTINPKLRRIAAAHMQDVNEIRDELSASGEATMESDLITYDELHFLMNPIEKPSE